MKKTHATKKQARPHAKTEVSSTERVRNTVLRCGVVSGLEMQVKSLTRRKITAEMAIRDIHLNHNGTVNGGTLMTFADIMASAGSAMNRPALSRGSTIESKTNFFAAGLPPVVRAVCVPLHVGRTTSVWETTLSNADGRVIAIVTQTQIALTEPR